MVAFRPHVLPVESLQVQPVSCQANPVRISSVQASVLPLAPLGCVGPPAIGVVRVNVRVASTSLTIIALLSIIGDNEGTFPYVNRLREYPEC